MRYIVCNVVLMKNATTVSVVFVLPILPMKLLL